MILTGSPSPQTVSSPGRGWLSPPNWIRLQPAEENLPRVDPMEQCGNALSVGGKQRSGRQPHFEHITLDCLGCWRVQVWPDYYYYYLYIYTTGTGSWLKNICGVEGRRKEKRVYSCAAVRMMWQITHLLLPGGKKNLLYRIYIYIFHCWRSSELVVLRVSCVIISWLSLVVAHTEGSSRRKRSRCRDQGG